MPIKIFEGTGRDGIKKMEAEINKWLAEIGSADMANRIKHMSTAAASVKDPGDVTGEVYQHLIVTFLYEDADQPSSN